MAVALRIRRKRSAAIRPFAPFQAEPFQIFVHGGDELRFAACKIQIFISQNQRAGVFLGAFLSRPEGSGVTKMQQACWRGRDSSAIGGVRRHIGIMRKVCGWESGKVSSARRCGGFPVFADEPREKHCR